MKGTLTARDGAVTPAEFQLVKEQGEWRILFIEVRATGAGAGIKGEEKSGKGQEQTQASPPAARIVTVKTCERVAEPGMTAIGVRNEFNTLSPEIHALVQLEDVKEGSELKGNWISVDAIGEPNYVIKSSVVKFEAKGDATAHFMISQPPNGWPPGNYKLDLYIDGKMAGTVPFTVSKTGQPGSASGGSQTSPNVTSGSMDLGPINKDPKRIWTIAVYMGADNDLDPFALKNLKEMERGLPEEGVECIVLVDRAKGPTPEGDDRTDRVVRIKRNTEKGLKSEVLARPGEVNMADPAVLEKFLASVIKTFPAQHYALIMWDHGGGLVVPSH